MITKDILIRFVNGDREAFDTIYASLSPSMYGICLRYTRCQDDAKDVLQESFIKLYETRNQFNVEMPIGPWMKKITVRTALNYIKKNYRFELTDNELVFDQSVFEEYSGLEKRELVEKLLDILRQLPDGYRTIFNLFAIENLTHKEIAAYLNISEGTSKSQYFKAKKMIGSLLEPQKNSV